MKIEKVSQRTTRDACAHLLAVGICTGVLFLFVALTYSQITLPRYSTDYSEKDVQQVVNLIIAITATVIGILFTHCRRLTNEAETKSELRNDELTIPRLHVHFEAASGSKVAMGIPVARNKQVWSLVAFYFLGMVIFAFVHSVLSVIFVIESIVAENGDLVPVTTIPLSIDVASQPHDPCIDNVNNPGCAYVLALHSISSQLVTYQPYSVAGVQFDPPKYVASGLTKYALLQYLERTMGLPYYAMKHFSDEVATIPFETARRRYCLPVLDPDVIKCTEVPIDPKTCESADNFVRFQTLNVSNWDADKNKSHIVPAGLYKITSPFPNPVTNYDSSKFRIDVEGRGVMIAQMFAPDTKISLIGGANAWGEHGYASLLYRLMYDGKNPDTSNIPDGATFDFAAKCELKLISEEDNLGSSWRQVDFTLRNGVLRANVTDESCPNARAPNGQRLSGFTDLTYALEAAGNVISSTDGYCKFFNEHAPEGLGTNIFGNMSRFETIVNQMYHLVQTAWTESSYEYAKKVPAVNEQPIIMTIYPNLFVIRISWTPVTWIGLVFSLLIALNAWALAVRWAMATYRFGFGAETWNLLRPVDLMAYSLAASQDLIHSLDTRQHRRMEMNGETRTVLHERPLDILSVMTGSYAKRTGSESNSSTPVVEYEQKAKELNATGVSVQERQQDVERGNGSP